MSEVKRYDISAFGGMSMDECTDGAYVNYEDYAELEAKCAALVAENSILNLSRAVLSENVLEACNAIASAGFRNEAIMKGFYASTGNGNKYPNPIATMVDEALSGLSIPATDAFMAEVRAQGVEMMREHPSIKLCSLTHICDELAAQLRKGGEQK